PARQGDGGPHARGPRLPVLPRQIALGARRGDAPPGSDRQRGPGERAAALRPVRLGRGVRLPAQGAPQSHRRARRRTRSGRGRRMIIALGLITAMFVIGYGAPRYLSVTVAPGLNPRLAITAWTASVTLVVAALIAAPVSMFTRPGRTAFGAAHACVQRLRDDGTLPWVDA